MQKEADEANKHSSLLERDNQRFEVQLSDMAHQVRLNGGGCICTNHYKWVDIITGGKVKPVSLKPSSGWL